MNINKYFRYYVSDRYIFLYDCKKNIEYRLDIRWKDEFYDILSNNFTNRTFIQNISKIGFITSE